jgi:hypothetical protein
LLSSIDTPRETLAPQAEDNAAARFEQTYDAPDPPAATSPRASAATPAMMREVMSVYEPNPFSGLVLRISATAGTASRVHTWR